MSGIGLSSHQPFRPSRPSSRLSRPFPPQPDPGKGFAGQTLLRYMTGLAHVAHPSDRDIDSEGSAAGMSSIGLSSHQPSRPSRPSSRLSRPFPPQPDPGKGFAGQTLLRYMTGLAHVAHPSDRDIDSEGSAAGYEQHRAVFTSALQTKQALQPPQPASPSLPDPGQGFAGQMILRCEKPVKNLLPRLHVQLTETHPCPDQASVYIRPLCTSGRCVSSGHSTAARPYTFQNIGSRLIKIQYHTDRNQLWSVWVVVCVCVSPDHLLRQRSYSWACMNPSEDCILRQQEQANLLGDWCVDLNAPVLRGDWWLGWSGLGHLGHSYHIQLATITKPSGARDARQACAILHQKSQQIM